MTMLGSITVLLVCQLLGEATARAFALPVPGPVIGMMLLFVGLLVVKGVPKSLENTGNALLSNLSLLFIPAGVGIVVHIGLIIDEWRAVAAGLILGTAITVAVSGWTMNRLLRGKDEGHE